jgi:hypothetical protein
MWYEMSMTGALSKEFVGERTMWFKAGSRYPQREDRDAEGLALPAEGLGIGGSSIIGSVCLPLPFDMVAVI